MSDDEVVYEGIYLGLTVRTAKELESKRLIAVTRETVDSLTRRVNELERESKRLKERARPRFVDGRRFTHCVDSYGINIYEGDEILDEVAGTTDFVVDYKGTWYLGDKNGYTLSGQLSAHLQRRCKVVE